MIKVLVIEGRNDNLQMIEEALDDERYTVHYSHGKKDGVEIAIRYAPELILFYYKNQSDINLIKRLLASEETENLPVIVIPQVPTFEDQRLIMECGADDYLPEYFIKTSLARTIEAKFSKLSKLRQNINYELENFEQAERPNKRADHLLVKLGTKLKLIKFQDIICITAMKEYSKIKTADHIDILVRKSMRNWVKLLPAESFLRIHRATIINMNCIENIRQLNGRTYTVSLKGLEDSFDFIYRYANIMRHSFPTG